MLRAIRRAFSGAPEEVHSPADSVRVAVAVLLHEARRADYAEGSSRETAAAEQALAEMFGLDEKGCAALLAEGREKAQDLTSLYAPVAAVKRAFSQEERIRLVERLWRVAFAEGGLDPHEDHYVRKVAHLLYVPNTQAMLARNRARDAVKP
ncbi:MAG TPA: TerB family tellurite resistance protein [Burkholderiales bacterium]|nr:TerB family tellurite resistance protein [Burkholderiales bacterium]